MLKYKIYICHYPPLVDRKKYLDSILPSLNIPYEYSTKYTTYDVDYEKYFSKSKKDLEFKNSFSSIVCYNFNLTTALKALCLEHINVYNKINTENLDFGIILEDDAIFVENFHLKLQETIDNLPKENWDVIYITNGCDNRSDYLEKGRKQNPTINNFVKMAIPYAWTGGGYIIKRETAKLFKDNIYPIVFPPDFELNYLQNRFNSNVYWLEQPIIYEGSNIVSKSKHKYQSSVQR